MDVGYLLDKGDSVIVKINDKAEVDGKIENISPKFFSVSFFSNKPIKIEKFKLIEIKFIRNQVYYSFLSEVRAVSIGMSTLLTCALPEEVQERVLRKHERIRLKSAVIIKYFNFTSEGTPNEDVRGLANDISTGGMSLFVKDKPLSDFAMLKIRLYQNLVLDYIDCKIVRIIPNDKGYNLGIKFINISEQDKNNLNNYLYND